MNNLTITYNHWDSRHVAWAVFMGKHYELTDYFGSYEWIEV